MSCAFLGTFKKMLKQKRADTLKQYEKQEKMLKKMKESGKSSKQAVSWSRSIEIFTCLCCLLVLQEKVQKDNLSKKKDRARGKQEVDEDQKPQELLEKPREYRVKFNFKTNRSAINPPILGLYGSHFMLLTFRLKS